MFADMSKFGMAGIFRGQVGGDSKPGLAEAGQLHLRRSERSRVATPSWSVLAEAVHPYLRRSRVATRSQFWIRVGATLMPLNRHPHALPHP